MLNLFSKRPLLRALNMSILSIATLMSSSLFSPAQAAEYTQVDTKASKISFSYSQMSVNMDGKIVGLKVPTFSFDPSAPEAAKLHIEIPVVGIDAGYAEANAELGKKEWLNAEAYPLASFKANSVKALGEHKYEVTGTLSIKGKTQNLEIPFTFREKDNQGVFSGSFSFNRADFDLGEGIWSDFSIVANPVTISFELLTTSP